MSTENPVTGADAAQNQNANANFTAPTSTNPTTASQQASAQNGGEPTSSTIVSSLSNLKDQAPKLYNAMLMGIATNICNQMQHAQERIKKAGRGQSNS